VTVHYHDASVKVMLAVSILEFLAVCFYVMPLGDGRRNNLKFLRNTYRSLELHVRFPTFLVQDVDYNLISVKLDVFFYRRGLDAEVVKVQNSPNATTFVNFVLLEISDKQRLLSSSLLVN
jgi:hypothetical protein